MSKERLEEIAYNVDISLDGEKALMSIGDYDFLYNYALQQAEHVEELEDKCNYLSDMNEMLVDLNGVLPDEPELYIKLKKENKRYREAIERAIDKLTWNSVESEEILRKALEGESDE